MSSATIVYKGMVQSSALKKFYLDLANELYVSQFAIYHRTVSGVLEAASPSSRSRDASTARGGLAGRASSLTVDGRPRRDACPQESRDDRSRPLADEGRRRLGF